MRDTVNTVRMSAPLVASILRAPVGAYFPSLMSGHGDVCCRVSEDHVLIHEGRLTSGLIQGRRIAHLLEK